MSVYNLHKMNGEKLFKFNKKFSALFLKNPLQFPETSCIITNVVTLIAVKREVVARKWQVFRGANVKLGNWRQVTVQINCPRRSEGIDKTWKYPSGKMSHQGEKVPWGICMDAKKHGRKVETTCESFCFSKQDTHGRVYSHRLSYWS